MGARTQNFRRSTANPAVKIGFFLLGEFASPDFKATGKRAKNGHLGSP